MRNYDTSPVLRQPAEAAAKVVQLAAADPTVITSASDIITAAKTSALKGGLTGLTTLNVQTLAADPAVLAACVPFIEAAMNVSGPYWAAVVPQVPAVPKVNHE